MTIDFVNHCFLTQWNQSPQRESNPFLRGKSDCVAWKVYDFIHGACEITRAIEGVTYRRIPEDSLTKIRALMGTSSHLELETTIQEAVDQMTQQRAQFVTGLDFFLNNGNKLSFEDCKKKYPVNGIFKSGIERDEVGVYHFETRVVDIMLLPGYSINETEDFTAFLLYQQKAYPMDVDLEGHLKLKFARENQIDHSVEDLTTS